MRRYELSLYQWRKIQGFLPGRPGWVGVTAQDNRRFVNGVLWVLRSGAHWKLLHGEYGNWKSVHKRFTRWAKSGIWERIFQVLLEDPNNIYVIIDSNIVRAHQQAACEKGRTRLWRVPKGDSAPGIIWRSMPRGSPLHSHGRSDP